MTPTPIEQALVAWQARHKRSQTGPRSERCSGCLRKRWAGAQSGPQGYYKWLVHQRSIPHVAAQFGVSVFALTDAVRGWQALHGGHPVERRRRRQKRTWLRMGPEERVASALRQVQYWKEKHAKAERMLRKWERRLCFPAMKSAEQQ